MLGNLILVLHVLMAVAIAILVLLQHGKGADMGAAFGSGSAGSLFGSTGAASFLSRATAVCATIFFITSIGLTYFHAPKDSSSVMTGVVKEASQPKVDEGKKAAETVPTSPANEAGSKSQQIPK